MEWARLSGEGELTLPLSIRKKLGIGTGDVLLLYERDGRVILAPATPDCLADARRADAERRVYTVDEIGRIAVPIAKRHGLRYLALFGSYARGDATPSSDIDFRVSVPKDFGMLRLCALQSDLEDAFSKKIDLITDGMLRDPMSAELARQIEQDEVRLYGERE